MKLRLSLVGELNGFQCLLCNFTRSNGDGIAFIMRMHAKCNNLNRYKSETLLSKRELHHLKSCNADQSTNRYFHLSSC